MGMQFLYHIRDGKFELEVSMFIDLLVNYDAYWAIENN